MGWFTKIVEVEKIVEVPVIQYVLGDPLKTSVYQCWSEDYADSYYHPKITQHGYFLSCKDAFKAHPNSKVQERSALKVGDDYFQFDPNSLIKVTPKASS